jgi:serine phosphatase RsbU (regulator of sigma subunit)
MTIKRQILTLAILGNLGIAATFLWLSFIQLAHQEKTNLDDSGIVYQQAWIVAAEQAFKASVGTWHPENGDHSKSSLWGDKSEATLPGVDADVRTSNNPLVEAIDAGGEVGIERVLEDWFGEEIDSAVLSFALFFTSDQSIVHCMTAAEGYGADPCAEETVKGLPSAANRQVNNLISFAQHEISVSRDILIMTDRTGVKEPSIFEVMSVNFFRNGTTIGSVILGKNLFQAVEFFESEFAVKVAVNFNDQTLILDNYSNVTNYSGIPNSAPIAQEVHIAIAKNREILAEKGAFGYMDTILSASVFGFPVSQYEKGNQSLFMVLRDQSDFLIQQRQDMQYSLIIGLTLLLFLIVAITSLTNYAFDGISKAISVIQAMVNGDRSVSINQRKRFFNADNDEINLLSGAIGAYKSHLDEMDDLKHYQQNNRRERDNIIIESMRNLAVQLEGDAKRLILSDITQMQQLTSSGSADSSEDASVELMSLAFSRMSKEVAALLDARTNEMRNAYEQASAANREIRSSIDYAAILQQALLRAERFPDDFKIHLTWQPRDVVGGDIYVVRTTENKTVIAVIDCTGHGVPGAFTSLIARAVFDRAIENQTITTAGQYLSESNRLIKDMLFQNDYEEGKSDAGFDGTVCILDRETGKLEFAGANSSLFIINNGLVTELKGDRKSVGARRTPGSYVFNTQIVDNPSGMFVMLTDGVTDVMSEMPRPTAFGRRRLMRLMESLDTSDPQFVVSKIMHAVDQYKGNGKLRDDLTLLAFYIDQLKRFDSSVIEEQLSAHA